MSDTAIPSEPEDNKKSKLGIAEWLGIAQLIALIVGAAWTAMLFLKFDAHEKELAGKKAEVELRKLNSTAVKFNQDITIWTYNSKRKCTKTHLGVAYRYAFSNITNQKYKVALVVIKAFSLPPLENTTGDAVEVPPIDISKESPWRNITTVACIAEGENPEDKTLKLYLEGGITPGINCGGVGEVEPGDSNWDSVNLIVRSRKSDYIGFRTEVYTRFENGTIRSFSSNQIARLSPGLYEDIPKSLSTSSKDDETK